MLMLPCKFKNKYLLISDVSIFMGCCIVSVFASIRSSKVEVEVQHLF